MPNVVAIINDDRARRQTEQYLEQLGIADLRFATFKTHQEFTALYYRNPAADSLPAEAAPTEIGAGELKLFSEVHLMIFALDSIGERSNTWLDKFRANMKRYKHWPATGPIRIVMLKYEDDGINQQDLLHPSLDDMIYMPLDRLLFMQKMEIFINLPKRVRPRFLFSQEVKQDIEISKVTKLDRFSDVGLAIRNPIALKKGLPGHFYLQLPGEKTRLEIHGKVFRSEPHPDHPGQFLVYFSYFGLPKSDLSTIRRSLAKAPRYQSLYNDDRSVFRYKPETLFEEKVDQFGVAVVDPEAIMAKNLAAQVTKDLDCVTTVAESSYSLFLHNYFDPSAKGDRPLPKPTEGTDFCANPLTLNVSAKDFKCLSVEPTCSETDLFLGHKATELFSNPEKWISLVTDTPSRLVLEESIPFAGQGHALDKLIIIQDSNEAQRAVNMHLKRGPADHLVTVVITPASMEDVVGKLSRQEANHPIQAIILDAAFVPEDTESWVTGLSMRAVQVGLVKNVSELKLYVVADGDHRAKTRCLKNPEVVGYFIKPVDTRQLGFLLSEFLPNKNTVYQFENLGWSQPSIPMHVSKNMQLEALSEFGATLKSKQVMASGSLIYLRRSIYENAPGQCLAARVYAYEEHPKEKDHYLIYVTYFGITDQFLKFARTYIRENYASQKAKEG